jgi:hypothetical protein
MRSSMPPTAWPKSVFRAASDLPKVSGMPRLSRYWRCAFFDAGQRASSCVVEAATDHSAERVDQCAPSTAPAPGVIVVLARARISRRRRVCAPAAPSGSHEALSAWNATQQALSGQLAGCITCNGGNRVRLTHRVDAHLRHRRVWGHVVQPPAQSAHQRQRERRSAMLRRVRSAMRR